MSPDELKARARRIAEELLTQGDLPLADELFARECRHYSPRPIAPGAAGVRGWVTALRQAFPDLRAIVEDEVAEGHLVAQRLNLIGTHVATFSEGAAQAQVVNSQAIELLRVGPDGRFTEHWCVWDEVDVLRQLGSVRADEGERP